MSIDFQIKRTPLYLIVFGFLFYPNTGKTACTPQPDMQGVLFVESCEYFQTGFSLPTENISNEKLVSGNKVKISLKKGDTGILLKGKFSKLNFIPARQTKREPRYRSSSAPAKEKYEQIDSTIDLAIFYQSSNKKMCKGYEGKSKTVSLNAYFYCCEPRPDQSSPCAVGAHYYTEEIR